jgi:hypothetical protein
MATVYTPLSNLGSMGIQNENVGTPLPTGQVLVEGDEESQLEFALLCKDLEEGEDFKREVLDDEND